LAIEDRGIAAAEIELPATPITPEWWAAHRADYLAQAVSYLDALGQIWSDFDTHHRTV
jgi:hypothetical protein